MGVVGGGAYAEQLVVHERQTMAVPASVGLPEAGAIPEVAITAYDALVLQGGLTAGGWALVHAGASGVGTAAIQLAHAVGRAGRGDLLDVEGRRPVGRWARTWWSTTRPTTSSQAVPEATEGRGVDVVLDVIGGEYVARNLRSCRVGGTIVQVGIMGGGTAEVPVGLLLTRRVRWIGTVLRGRPLEEKIAVTRRCEHDLVPLYESGRAAPGDRPQLPARAGGRGPRVRRHQCQRRQGAADGC